MSEQNKQTPMNLLHKLARDACRKHKEPQAAISCLRDKINGDPSMKRRLVTVLINNAISDAIYDIRHRNLTTIKGKVPRGGDAIALASDSIGNVILKEWILPDGTTLGEATPAMLSTLAADEAEKAFGHSCKSTFYQLLAGRTPNGKTVKSWCSNSKARSLWEECSKRPDDTLGAA